ncbi:hypothetical protein HPB47_000428 [Ixodes persulcatus]|uniref:Uncharacterized protein n=1 Tax=Ixodes persulcatus TaxID=34615 RepID=A0AC60PRU5_IXOPE|nr:hypothetical protein HPB47_000428 [Ixodes persulcatus]
MRVIASPYPAVLAVHTSIKFGGCNRFSKRKRQTPKEDNGSASFPFSSAPPSPSALESPIASLPPADHQEFSHPGPSASASSLPVTEISSEEDLTAIEQKIAMMERKAPAECFEPNDPEKQLGLTESEELNSYHLLGQREWVHNRRKAAVASTSTVSSASYSLAKEEHIARLESLRREQNQQCKGRRRANATDYDRATEAKHKREARRRLHSTPAEQFLGATARFHREFVDYPFGVTCTVCDQLWFAKDGLKPGTDGYTNWMEDHRPNCQKNFNGSAGAMEVEAATVIFGRSVEKHGMHYTTMLCDGTSKAFSKVAGLELYDKEIKKEDCVNHVANRMYAGLETLKKAKKGPGGKRKLTNLKMKQLTNYYACSLKDNAPDVTAMQRGVFASFLHSYSIDGEPRHVVSCPTGMDSRCHYSQSKFIRADDDDGGRMFFIELNGVFVVVNTHGRVFVNKNHILTISGGIEVAHEMRCLRRWLKELEARLPNQMAVSSSWTVPEIQDRLQAQQGARKIHGAFCVAEATRRALAPEERALALSHRDRPLFSRTDGASAETELPLARHFRRLAVPGRRGRPAVVQKSDTAVFQTCWCTRLLYISLSAPLLIYV